MKILSPTQIHQADAITLQKQNISSIELMERAGTKIFEWLDSWLKDSPNTIHIFCGVGNNGGDGLVVGRLLYEKEYDVAVYVVKYSDNHSADFDYNLRHFEKSAHQKVQMLTKAKDIPKIKSQDLIIDAIFGIGLNRSPQGWVKEVIQRLTDFKSYKIAIDIPSGLFANSAVTDASAIFKADHTLSLQIPKLAFYLPETAKYVGSFDVLDIGLDSEYLENVEPLAYLVTRRISQKLYIPREKFGFKNTYGHALIIGGSYGKIGSTVLSTKAAFRVGCGLVTTFVPKCGLNILQTTIPEAMVIADAKDDFITNIAVDFEPSAIGVGIGMGKNPASVQALKKFFSTNKVHLVIDADALNIISENPEVLKYLSNIAILTPHPGELKRLIGNWKDDYDKLEKVKNFSTEHQLIIVIKGANSMIIQNNKIYINTTGNPGMGTAGSGDALTGVITGLLSQGYDKLSAAIFGVYMHGKAGDFTAINLGQEAMMAGDIVENISEAYLHLFSESDKN